MIKLTKNVFKSIFCSILILSVFFYIAEYSAYRPESPRFIGSIVEPFKEEGVHIQAKVYNGQDSKAYLSKNLNDVGFRPVQLTIQNNTRNTYFLSSQGVDIQSATTTSVSNHVTAAGIPKSIALKVAGFLFWPFMIPATIDSILTFKSHANMKADYHAKSIKAEGEPIVPYSTVHRILFVPENQYSESFTLNLKDGEKGYLHGYPVKINS